MEDQNFYSVVENYEKNLADSVKKNSNEYIDNIAKEISLDLEDNKARANKINNLFSNLNDTNKIIGKLSSYKTASIVFIVISILLVVLSSLYFARIIFKSLAENSPESKIVFIVLMIVGILLLIILPIILKIKILPKLKNQESIKQKVLSEINEEKLIAKKQLNPFFNELDNNLIENITTKVLPIVKFDQTFQNKKFQTLDKKYNFNKYFNNNNESSIFVKSGELRGNPFVLQKILSHEMGTQTYSGSLTVSWQESYRDSEGRLRYRTEYETLTAHITKPFPLYFKHFALFYGNDACPKLNFTRTSSGIDLYSKNLDKKIQKAYSALEKREKKATSIGSNFQLMQNEEFEVLFNALDRNNEQQYRMLFTPLAQIEMTKLIKSSNSCGDNFNMLKDGKLNIVYPKFVNTSDEFYLDFDEYTEEYDFEIIKTRLVKDISKIFHSFYYSIAPLLCIPIYMDTKYEEYNELFTDNYRDYATIQQEEVINNLAKFKDINPKSYTPSIIKIEDYQVNKDSEHLVSAVASGYSRHERIEYVSVRCRNGRYYNVPVTWYEFIKEVNKFKCSIKHEEKTKVGEIKNNVLNNENGLQYIHNIICGIIKDN